MPRVEAGVVLDRFYRLGDILDSARPDDRNTVVVRLATTVEQVGRIVWEAHMDTHPDDDGSVELIMRRNTYERAGGASWGRVVAASHNISTIDGLRSIFDRCGMGSMLDGGLARKIERVMEQRNSVVHRMEDADIDVKEAHRTVEEFMQRAFSDSRSLLITAHFAKARAAERLPSCPWDARECYEDVVKMCDAGGDIRRTPAVLAYKGAALSALGRHGEALGAYDEAVRIDPKVAGSHSGRGDALSALGRHGEALGAYSDGHKSLTPIWVTGFATPELKACATNAYILRQGQPDLRI